MNDREPEGRRVWLNSTVLVAAYLAVAVLGILALVFIAANLPAILYWLLVILVALALLLLVLSVLSLFVAIPFYLSIGEGTKEGSYSLNDHEDSDKGRQKR